MQSRKLKNLITIFFVLFIFSSCSRDYIVPEPPSGPPAPPSPNENKISYSGVIQPIFTAKCVKCHGPGQSPPVLTSGKSYQSLWSLGMIDTITPGNSELYITMKPPDGNMYKNKNSNTKAESDSVYKWIRQGAKNN
jgi:hypothetical protein